MRLNGHKADIQCTICSTASASSSLRSITPVCASRNRLLQAPSKKPDREQMMARWTSYLFSPQTMVRSEYFPTSRSLVRGQQMKDGGFQGDLTFSMHSSIHCLLPLWQGNLLQLTFGERVMCKD